ncbi:MAG: hypothetical protein SCM11_08900 [Bacillota bacterium]|nr:hypothetical protein [Bacillota bacterium]
MKMIKNKQLLVESDFAGYPLKEIVVKHLQKIGWKIIDIGVSSSQMASSLAIWVIIH